MKISSRSIFLTLFICGCLSGYSWQVRDAASSVYIAIIDSLTQQPTPARVRLTLNNRPIKILPEQAVAVMYGVWDNADGYGFQPDSSFYVDGNFQALLPPGDYTIALSKGLEYLDQQHALRVESGKPVRKTFVMSRWINMPQQGWYSGDDHIHIRRTPREDPMLMKWLQAEDVHVGVLLRMGDFWATYYEQYGWGEKGAYLRDNYMLTSGQEDPRTPEVGHTLGLGASDKVRYRDEYYYYDKVFDALHRLGGITGYAHQAESFHGYRGLMLDGLRRKVDALELLQFCVSEDPLQTRHYYHMLDLGFAVTAIAGSDFPWCGHDHDVRPIQRNARIGNARFYTYIKEPLTFKSWRAAVKKGHTFVTSGPVLDLKLNDALPGDTVKIKTGEQMKLSVHAYGHDVRVPLKKLELVKHGQVIATVTPDRKTQTASHLSIELNSKAEEGYWIAARAYAGEGQAAHTTPIYVSVNNSGFHNRATAAKYLELAESYLKELEEDLAKVKEDPELQSWRYKKGFEKRIEEVRRVIAQLKVKLK